MNAVIETKEATLDIGIDDECPICAKLRDPQTGALPYNAKVLAAMEETKAIMRGEIPTKWYKSIEEAREDLGLWNEPLPERCREHKLHGNWDGFTECHIEGDWVMIYMTDGIERISFSYTGTHSDLL
jgi:mRNA interferase YafQ